MKGNAKAVSVDDCLYHYALQKNIKVSGLETYEESARALVEATRDSAEYLKSLKEQAADLYDAIVQMEKIAQMEKVSASTSSYEMYLSGDLEKLYSKNLSFIPNEVYEQKMGAERNNRWLRKIEDILKDRTCLIAVGAMHLPGDKGLIALLRTKGYDVQPAK